MYENEYYTILKKPKKKKLIIKSVFIGILVGLVAQYVVDIVINILAKKSLSNIFKFSSSWQIYYTSVIAGGINGALVVILPEELFSFAAVFVITAVYNALQIFSTKEELEKEVKTNHSFVVGIIRDVFIILLVVYLMNKIGINKKEKTNIELEDFESLLAVTLVSSIVLNISFYLTQTGINQILGLTSVLSGSITFDV